MKIRVFKFIALFLAVNFLAQVVFPTVAFALTGGPSQPEVESFEPIGTSEMVDVFSGDFVYNIPLLNVGNYPINISYHSGVSMDQEASWVGLGWNINPGVINRNMRGLPDDFNGNGTNGDFITKKFNIKPNRTYGITGMISPEALQFNFLSIGLGMGISFNNYRGFAMESTQHIGISAAGGNKGENTASLGLNVSTNSQEGMTIEPTVSFERRVMSSYDRDQHLGPKVGASFNSRAGLTALTLKRLGYTTNQYGEVMQQFLSKNGGSSISFVSPTYITPSTLPMQNTSVTLNLSYGATAFGTDFLLAFSGYYSEQKLRTNEMKYRSYGYMNSDQYKTVGALLDFNREKDVSFTKNTPALPVTNFTYDIYSVSGQGIGGMYRPYRNDVGTVHDSFNNNGSDSYSLGVEFGGGWVASFGLDPRVVLSNTTTSKWFNALTKKLKFQGKEDQPDNMYYEPYYFKQAGEKAVDSEFELEESFFNKIGGFDAVRTDLKSGGGFEVNTENHFKSVNGNTIPISDVINRNKRQKRNESISVLTFKEARDFAVRKSLYSETAPEKAVYKGKDHHIAEMTTVNAQGMRYVYGIPAYNNLQREVSFSTGESPKRGQLAVDYSTGLVTYSTDGSSDNSISNERGIDNYYQMNETPAYAHSYLLTSVLSPDYVDNDKIPGPSETDMGTYTLFNYEKVSDYNWRIPVGEKKANSEEGLSSLTSDDHANYVYGTKEVWYLKSIEDKNFIAEFFTGEREDGLGVVDEDGKINPNKKLKYLKEIKLYNKNDRTTPIKTVHFVYDYSLCGNLPNNSGIGIDENGRKEGQSGYDPAKNINAKKGKLTLKRIYFTYKDSKKAKFSPYDFTYHSVNPDYHIKMYDRWGNFKQLPNLSNLPAVSYDYRSNANFPYTEQDKVTADKNASAWNLTDIALPSGGSIKVKYESDDYAYVQDKEAMQMFKVAGVAQNISENVEDIHEHLYKRSTNEDFKYIVVDVGPGVSTEDFKKKYLRDIKSGGQELYFKFKVNLGSKNWNDLTYNQKTESSDFVPGYVNIVNAEVRGSKAFLEMQLVPIGDRGEGIKISPIAKAALQFVRLYNPRLAYGLTDINDGAVDQVLLSIINSSPTKNLFAIAKGINKHMMDNQLCREFIAKESFIRLYNPNGRKFGGGCRVASIQVLDNSSKVLADDREGVYGQKYSYTTTDQDGKVISSGVASYEPLIGGDENPHRRPVAYGTKQEKLLVPDDRFYLEEPFGECFFPGASVGYSKVTVQSINEVPTDEEEDDEEEEEDEEDEEEEGEEEEEDLIKEPFSKSGSVVHEFYTAKDFPTIVDRTDLQLLPKKSNIALRLLKIQQKDYMNASQGYVIELNDMHGKPKAQWVYGHGQKTYISGVEYKYKRSGNRLVNDATIILPDGRISNAKIGVDFDFVADMRRQESTTESFGINGNLAMFLAAILPASVPLILPAYAKEETRFRSSVTTKVINRYGLLDEVIAYDLGSKVATQNIGYDGETGEVLVTKVQNNFDDPLYNFTFPAHWAHNRMGPAYQNIGVEFSLELASGTATSSSNPFEVGDELIAIYNKDLDDPTKKDAVLEEMKYRFYVVEKTKTKVTILGGKTSGTNPSSTLLNGKTTFKIIRSGKRNMSNIPVGNVVCLKNPLKADNSDQLKAKIDFAAFDHMVLSASASEFSDDWKIFCACDIDMGQYYNPVYYGAKGIWRPKKSYTFLTDRSKTSIEANLRKDGYFKGFNSFWKTPTSGSTVWESDIANWQWTSEITSYDPYGGNEMENKDPLERYANSGSGFNHQVPVTVSANAKYSDILFESFEEGDKKSCVEQKIKFTGGTIENKSHTGRSSIKIPKSSGGSSMTNLPICK